jgi:hypothetical protein
MEGTRTHTLDVNPVFIQFIDQDGKLIEKSPNLKNKTLSFDPKHVSNVLL